MNTVLEDIARRNPINLDDIEETPLTAVITTGTAHINVGDANDITYRPNIFHTTFTYATGDTQGNTAGTNP